MRDGAPFKRRRISRAPLSEKAMIAASGSDIHDAGKIVSDELETLYVIRAADGRPITTRFTKYAAKKKAQEIPGATIHKYALRALDEKASA